MTPPALRLRRRRDGVLLLVDADFRDTPDRVFPEAHGFTLGWLLANADHATLATDTVRLELGNARATYRVTASDRDLVQGELEDVELFDAPPLDEAKAAAIQDDRRERVLAEIGDSYGVDRQTAERLWADFAARFGSAPAPAAAPAQDDVEG